MNRAAGGLLRKWWFVGLMLLLCACEAWRPIDGGQDFWFHAAVGRWIVGHGGVPHHTLFLWSATLPWVYHSWLSEIGIYGLMALGGERWGPVFALAALTALVGATFGLLWRLWTRERRAGGVALFFFAAAIEAANQRFQARPDQVSALFFAVLLVFLVHWTQRPRDLSPRAFWRTPTPYLVAGLFALWSNCHPGLASGLLVLTLAAFADLAQERGSPRSKSLCTQVLAAILALNFNAYGWHLISALTTLHSAVSQTVGEWEPIFRGHPEPWTLLTAQVIIFAGALFAWYRGARRWAHLVWLAAFALAYVMARRNAELCALTALAVMAGNAAAFDFPSFSGVARQVAKVAATAGLSVFLLFWCFTIRPYHPLVGAMVPHDLALRLRAVPATAHLFNDYDFADYLEWRLGGTPPLFIDAVNAYPDSVFYDYDDVIRGTPRGQQILASGLFDYVALPALSPIDPDAGILRILAHDPKWHLDYHTSEGTLWHHDGVPPL